MSFINIKYKIKSFCIYFLHNYYGIHTFDAIRIAGVDPGSYPFCVYCKKTYNEIINITHTLTDFYADKIDKKLIDK